MAQLVSTPKWQTYLDLEETSAWMQFAGVPTSDSQDILQRMIDSACTQGQKIADRPFAPTEYKERHDGWSGEYIMLRYSPFLQLVAATEWQSTGGPIILTESTPANPVEGIQIDYATSRIMRTFAGGSWPKPFFPGSRNIEITYLAGFNPIPPDIWQATVDLVAYWWRNTQQASRGWQPNAPEYGGTDGTENGLWPGVPNRIAEIFESYRLYSVG